MKNEETFECLRKFEIPKNSRNLLKTRKKYLLKNFDSEIVTLETQNIKDFGKSLQNIWKYLISIPGKYEFLKRKLKM